MPDLIRHPEDLENPGCARSLRLTPPPFGLRLEFKAGMMTFLETISLWTDSNEFLIAVIIL